MRILVTGSASHLGEALVRTLQNTSREVVSLDLIASAFTNRVGSISDRDRVKQCMKGVDAVLHTATLHKPHVSTHSCQSVVSAHLLAIEKAASIGFSRYIISATTPFTPEDLWDLRVNAPLVVQQKFPDYEEEYACRNWKMFPNVERVYVNDRARHDLGWQPRYDFRHILNSLKMEADPRSPIARAVAAKGYHVHKFVEVPYPVE